MTQSPQRDQIKRGEKLLEDQHQNSRFGPLLLRLLTQKGCADNIKLGASIYFKNFVKKYWGRDEEIISIDDQNLIKQIIVRVMLDADKNTQRLVSDAISIIASHDFYTKWDTLLPVESLSISLCLSLSLCLSVQCGDIPSALPLCPGNGG